MGLRALFVIVAAAIFVAALGVLVVRTPPRPAPGPDAIVIAPPAPDELPPPRTAKPPLPARLAAAGFTQGDAVFVRVFKDERVLEVWLKRGERYALFDSYPICAFSGGPGPKLAEGDGQSPEGFYEVGRRQLNPDSAYHLAFDLGFPNAHDRMLGRTGSYLMVHGSCVSIGCYAMTDHGITEIYGLVAAALEAGQPGVPVHIFPFRMTPSAMAAAAADSTWAAFWANLKEGYDAFEATHVPPRVSACEGRYAFGAAGAGCTRIAAW